ncbi:MAG: hypothetical protein FWE61_06875 [Micrococcales bacterium]|nr:hypothetical protein [Micrococcales bacterium]
MGAALALTLSLGGCATDPTSPPITDPPVSDNAPSAEPDPRTRAEQEAIQAFVAFNDAYNKLRQNGYDDRDDYVLSLTCGEFTVDFTSQNDIFYAAGARQVGEEVLSGFKVVDQQFVPNGLPFVDDSVTFEVCIDSSNTDVVRPDGSSVLQRGSTGRFVTAVAMWRHKDPNSEDHIWKVASVNVDRGRPC